MDFLFRFASGSPHLSPTNSTTVLWEKERRKKGGRDYYFFFGFFFGFFSLLVNEMLEGGGFVFGEKGCEGWLS